MNIFVDFRSASAEIFSFATIKNDKLSSTNADCWRKQFDKLSIQLNYSSILATPAFNSFEIRRGKIRKLLPETFSDIPRKNFPI